MSAVSLDRAIILLMREDEINDILRHCGILLEQPPAEVTKPIKWPKRFAKPKIRRPEQL